MRELVRYDVLDLRVGEVVEVRSEEEILATLDERGELDGLPFMPEMLQFCGRRFGVDKRAMKLCDTISGGRDAPNGPYGAPPGGALRRPGPRRLPGGLIPLTLVRVRLAPPAGLPA